MDEVIAADPVWTSGRALAPGWTGDVQLRAHGQVSPARIDVDGTRVVAELRAPSRALPPVRPWSCTTVTRWWARRPSPPPDGSARTSVPGPAPPAPPDDLDRAALAGGAATGIGSLPGDDPMASARLVFDELPDLPFVPELPARGPGADLIGRTTALLVDLPVQLEPTGWRFAGRPGLDLRRSKDLLARDLDAVEQVAAGFVGAVKVQVAGPITLAASIELPNGHRAVSDPGATRDLAESVREGVRLHLQDLAVRLPNATILLQLDEPSLPAALGARIPTPSGYGTVRAVPAQVAQDHLADVLSVAPAGARVVHCCAPDVPVALMRAAGADALALDHALITNETLDALGEAVDGGVGLWLGVIPTEALNPSAVKVADAVVALWTKLGFDHADLAATVVVTPACGLAGSTPDTVRRILLEGRDLQPTADLRSVAKGLLMAQLGLPAGAMASVFPDSTAAAPTSGLLHT